MESSAELSEKSYFKLVRTLSSCTLITVVMHASMPGGEGHSRDRQ